VLNTEKVSSITGKGRAVISDVHQHPGKGRLERKVVPNAWQKFPERKDGNNPCKIFVWKLFGMRPLGKQELE
jgi:hypothetical protein